jgi:esterase FrsA
MRHQKRRWAVTAFVAVVTAVAAGCGATGTPDTDAGVGPSAAASGSAAPVEALALDEEKWFREVRLEDWTTHGGDPAVMAAVLHRIQQATGEREDPERFDTVTGAGAGNWLTEWTTAAEEASSKAEAARSGGDSRAALNQYRQASLYFTVAAYPQHRETAEEDEAFRQGKDAYEKAARLAGWNFERLQVPLEGGTFEAFLHLPAGDGPFPVVITAGGVDFSKTENAMLFEEFLAPAGTAMVTFDNAGFGDSKDWPADRPDTDRLYSAIIDVLLTDQRIDAERIGAMGQSYGGNSAARLAFTDERVKAVASVCGPVHESMIIGIPFVENLPPQPRATLSARYNVAVEDTERIAQLLGEASLVSQGLVGTVRTDTPILALSNADDPFAPVEDLERLAASSTAGEVEVVEGHGHCPLIRDRNPVVADWFERVL